jgi:hypothetical protein
VGHRDRRPSGSAASLSAVPPLVYLIRDPRRSQAWRWVFPRPATQLRELDAVTAASWRSMGSAH